MKIKVTFLFFVLGAVGGLAEREGSEDNQDEYNITIYRRSSGSPLCSTLYSKPGEKDLFCGPSLKPTLSPKLMTEKFMRQLFLFFEKQLLTYFKSIMNKFEMMVKEINFKKEGLEDSLYDNLQSAEKNLKNELKDDIKKIEEEGEDEDKIHKCLKEIDFKKEMREDLEHAFVCTDGVTETAKIILEKSFHNFNKTFGETFDEIKKQAEIAITCAKKKNPECILKSIADSNKKTQDMIDFTESYMEDADGAFENFKEEIEGCSKQFMEHLSQVKDAFSTLFWPCVSV